MASASENPYKNLLTELSVNNVTYKYYDLKRLGIQYRKFCYGCYSNVMFF